MSATADATTAVLDRAGRSLPRAASSSRARRSSPAARSSVFVHRSSLQRAAGDEAPESRSAGRSWGFVALHAIAKSTAPPAGRSASSKRAPRDLGAGALGESGFHSRSRSSSPASSRAPFVRSSSLGATARSRRLSSSGGTPGTASPGRLPSLFSRIMARTDAFSWNGRSPATSSWRRTPVA